jgi:hypothetical protein
MDKQLIRIYRYYILHAFNSPLGAGGYSYLNASTGSNLEAFFAG